MPRLRVLVLSLLISTQLTAIVLAQPAAKANNELRVHFLPIGAGSCHIVECPGPPATTAPII